MSFDAHLLSLRTLFDPALAEDFEAELELRLGDERFRAQVRAGELALERGEADRADAVVTTDAATLLAVCHGRVGLDEAVRAGELSVEGDEKKVARFTGLFTLPEPAIA